MGLSITKQFSFCYAHKLSEHKGKCKNIHGHNATLEIELTSASGVVSDYEGMILDFGDMKKVINGRVIDILDHTYLNENNIAPFSIPTAENITKWVVSQLEPIWGEGLIRVRVYETLTAYAEWRRS